MDFVDIKRQLVIVSGFIRYCEHDFITQDWDYLVQRKFEHVALSIMADMWSAQ